MKVLTLQFNTMFSRLSILSETFDWNLNDVQIFNKILLQISKSLRIPLKPIRRTAYSTFEHDRINLLSSLPRKLRKLVLRMIVRIYLCIVSFPQYFETILSLVPFMCTKSMYVYFLEQFNSDKLIVQQRYGKITDIELNQILVRILPIVI